MPSLSHFSFPCKYNLFFLVGGKDSSQSHLSQNGKGGMHCQEMYFSSLSLKFDIKYLCLQQNIGEQLMLSSHDVYKTTSTCSVMELQPHWGCAETLKIADKYDILIRHHCNPRSVK